MKLKCPIFKMCEYAKGVEPVIEKKPSDEKEATAEPQKYFDEIKERDGVEYVRYKCSVLPEDEYCLLVPLTELVRKK